MTSEERERLIEQVAGAWRPRDKSGRTRSHPGWHDLDPADRQEAARTAEVQRRLEAELDDQGQSTTVKAVLARIRRAEESSE